MDRTTGEVIRAKRGARGSWLLPAEDGIVRGIFPGPAMMFAEGRLAAMVARSAASHDLAPATALTVGASIAAESFTALGFPSPSPVVRRLDLAGDLLFSDPADGLAFLRALASLDMPGAKRDVWMTAGRVETIYYRTPKRGEVRLRVYDKGVEVASRGGGKVAAGSRVRVERQVRYSASKQRSAAEVASSDLASLFQGRLGNWTTRTTDVVVGDLSDAQSAVLDRLATRQVSARVAERLLGTLMLMDHFGEQWWDKTHTAARRRRELDQLGIVLDAERATRRTVPVGQLLGALRDSFAVE